MLCLKGLLSFILLLFVCTIQAQQPKPFIATPEYFGIGRKLSVQSVFDMETDMHDRIYFTGTKGVYRFNGVNRTPIPMEMGVMNTYFAIHKDKNLLWVSGPSGLGLIKGDHVLEISLPEEIFSKMSQLTCIHLDSKGGLHLGFKRSGYFILYPNGSMKEVIGQNNSDRTGIFFTALEDNTPFYFGMTQPAAKKLDNRFIHLYHFLSANEIIELAEINEQRFVHDISFVEQSDGSFWASTGNHCIIHFDKDRIIDTYYFDDFVIKLFIDHNDVLWIGTLNSGIYKVENSNFDQKLKLWNGAAAVLTKNKDGGLWLKSDSTNYGYISPLSTPNFSISEGNQIKTLRYHNGQLIIQNQFGWLYSIFQGKIIKLPIKHNSLKNFDHKIDTRPTNFFYDSKLKTWWFLYRGMIRTWDGTTFKKSFYSTGNLSGELFRDVSVTPDGRVLSVYKWQVCELKNDSIYPISELRQQQLMECEVDSNGTIWVSGRDGVWILENGKFIRPFKNPIADLEGIVSHMFSYQNDIWFIAHNSRVYKTSADSIQMVKTADDTPLAMINYSISPNGKLWGLNSSGLLCLVEPEKLNIVSVHEFGFEDFAKNGYPGDNLVATDSTIYIGSNNGVFAMPIADLKPETRQVNVLLSSVRVNHKLRSIEKHYNLGYNENYLNLSFEAITYRGIPFEFAYQLEGLDSTWHLTNFNQLQYTNLAPGEYTFKLSARVYRGDWSPPKITTFTIATPYWKTWSFRAIAVVLSSLLIFLVLYLREAYVRRKEREKSRIALELSRLEMRALKAQINPHFIFNSITSAMYYLSQNSIEKAESYLNRFAKLTRSVLEASDKQFVPLQEEIELMRHYVMLETERFEGEATHFDVQLNGINPEAIAIPPALIQPYLENSIRHGLRTKEGKRAIRLVFKRVNDLLNVTIIDNGIGRKAANLLNTSTEQKSFGLLISSKRIEILNGNHLGHVNITDLYGENKEPTGTEVSFSIPISNLPKQ